MAPIALGIIGVGNMGKNHVRLARDLKNLFDLSAIYDPSEEQIKRLELEDLACASEEELLNKVDAVVIAAPSSMHKRLGLQAAEHNVHLLMEKPLALSKADAQEVVEAYDEIGKVLIVDQVERFNPVIRELEKILRNEVIAGVEIERCSPKDLRISDTDVIHDLMIHDIDILVNAVMPDADVRSVAAYGKHVYSEHYMDYVQALFQFENDVVASIISSRTTEGKIRLVRLHCETSYIEADMLNRTLTISRKTKYALDLGYTPQYSQENVTERVFVPNVEPLRCMLEHFGECIQSGQQGITNGRANLRSLGIVDTVESLVYEL